MSSIHDSFIAMPGSAAELIGYVFDSTAEPTATTAAAELVLEGVEEL